MPRAASLTRADFAHTRGFRRVGGPSLSLAYGAIPGRGSRGAIVVSKKVARSAVERNRLKRALRPLLVQFLTKAGAPSLVVTVRKNIANADLRAECESVLAKVPLSP